MSNETSGAEVACPCCHKLWQGEVPMIHSLTRGDFTRKGWNICSSCCCEWDQSKRLPSPHPAMETVGEWVTVNARMPPQGQAVLMRRVGSEQIPMWEWQPTPTPPAASAEAVAWRWRWYTGLCYSTVKPTIAESDCSGLGASTLMPLYTAPPADLVGVLAEAQVEELTQLIVDVEVDARHAGLRGDESSAYGPTLKRALEYVAALTTKEVK